MIVRVRLPDQEIIIHMIDRRTQARQKGYPAPCPMRPIRVLLAGMCSGITIEWRLTP